MLTTLLPGHHRAEGGLCVPHQELPQRHRRRGGPQEPRPRYHDQEEEADEWKLREGEKVDHGTVESVDCGVTPSSNSLFIFTYNKYYM